MKKRGRPKKIVTQEDESITENKTKKTVEKKNVSKEEIAKILYEENIRLKIYFNEDEKV